MRWALLTTALGFLVVWQLTITVSLLLPICFVFIFGYTIYIYWKRLEILPSIRYKLQGIVTILLVSGLFLLILYLLIQFNSISIWWYPPIFGIFVLFRSVFKYIVNLTVHEPKSFGIVSVTERGETVRSKSEKKVADWLYHNNIDYEYEPKIILPNNETILSDFYLPSSNIYIEYWGLSNADNATGEQYRERKKEKKQLYQQYHYKLMDIYPHHLYELDTYIPEQISRLTTSSPSFLSRLKALFFGYSTLMPSNPISDGSTDLFCTNCGSSVTQLGEFCVKCGTRVK